jgi:citrate/tricarballylate utilization protein
VSAASLAVVAVAAAVLGGVEALTTAHTGENSFYNVIPWAAMVIPAMVLAILALIVIVIGGVRFWRQGVPQGRPRTLGAWLGAAKDAATLRNMRGEECSYPGEEHASGRWIYHSLLFFGYVSALVSTTIAAFLGEILQVPPPYPLLSPPVVFGVAGGIGMIVGAAGLLWLKFRTQRDLSHPEMRSLDLALLVMTLAVAGSGMLLLALRDTVMMPTMLVLHLGFVAALFVTAPYGKLVHGVYRYLALVRDRIEQD